MNRKLLLIGFVIVLALASATAVLARVMNQTDPAQSLLKTVRDATEQYQDVAAAEAAGYGLFHGCVSSPQEGAMGVHFVKGELVGDGALDATQPEALLYEFRGNQARLVGVEYVVLADDWNANNDMPPVLGGQLFNLVGSPNRYGIPAFYELHVWAWKGNTLGTFVDWNPKVTCREFTPDSASHAHSD